MHSRHSVSKSWLLRALIVTVLRNFSPAAALTINAPVGLFDRSTEASQAWRHEPERNWRLSARVSTK